MKKLIFLTLALVVAASTLAVAGVHIVGGTKAAGNTIPWWSAYNEGRFQCMWRQTDIGERGWVTRIEFQFFGYQGSPPHTFYNVDMLLCKSVRPTMSPHFPTNYDGWTPTKVYSGNFVIPSGLRRDQWFTQCTPTNFEHRFYDNLVFEISWYGDAGGTTGNYFWIAKSGQPGRVFTRSKTAEYGTLYPSEGQVARITLSPTAVESTSLGRVKTIFR